MSKRAEQVYKEITCYANYSQINGIEKEYIIKCIEEGIQKALILHGVVESFYCYDETVQIAEETGDKIIRCDKQCEKCKQ